MLSTNIFSPMVKVAINWLNTNDTCEPSDTADMESWLSLPSMTVSLAPTSANMNCWNAMGRTRRHPLFQAFFFHSIPSHDLI